MSDDRRLIRDLVENWARVARRGRLGALRHRLARRRLHDGDLVPGPGRGLHPVSREGFERGVSILHFLGGTSIDLAGARAIAQTKMTISQRAEVHGVRCDVVCTGRFYDFLEQRDGRWGIVLRQPIYEKDRLDPVDPAATLDARPELLARFPAGYRHLAYVQTRDRLRGQARHARARPAPRSSASTRRGADWLAGGPCELGDPLQTS